MFRVSLESQKHEWKFGTTRNAVESQAAGECLHNKFSRVFLQLDRKLDNMFSAISFRKHRDETKENNLLTTLIIKMYIPFARAIITSTAHASSLFQSSFSINLL